LNEINEEEELSTISRGKVLIKWSKSALFIKLKSRVMWRTESKIGSCNSTNLMEDIYGGMSNKIVSRRRIIAVLMENGGLMKVTIMYCSIHLMMSRWIKEHCIVLSIKRGYDMVPGIQ
jgi:hypothetical protein